MKRPDWPSTDAVELMRKREQLPPQEQARLKTEFMATHPQPAQRLYLGRKEDRSSALELEDAQGSPALQFLDENGGVVSQLLPPAPVPPAPR